MRSILAKITHILTILIIGGIGVQTIISCSGDDGGGGSGSSMLSPCTNGTVTIGTQTWQKCNLNVDPGTGKSACYEDDPANCAIYGKLYDWAAAMALPDSCVSSICASQINFPHQGICQAGWHIPSHTDWEALAFHVWSDKGCCVTKYLKAKTGWNESGNGLDSYGFSALPGGNFGISGFFIGIGVYGEWWASGERESGRAKSSSMWYSSEDITRDFYNKSALKSVRCLKDYDYSSSTLSLCTDGTVTIGTQTWQKCNSNAIPSKGNSSCFYNDPAFCQKYGRLYDWEAAMSVCPSGWHLPSNEDWDKLSRYVDGTNGTGSPYQSETAGTKLKATSGWKNLSNGESGNGQDTYGFAALPGGFAVSDDYFENVGSIGQWWSSSEERWSGSESSDRAYIRIINHGGERVRWSTGAKYAFSSVRCLQD